jgi:NitT/TauT family transport system substrate-binding protein
MNRATFTAGVLAAMAYPSVARAQGAMPTVRVAVPPLDAASQVFYAKDKGFFTKVGLNVEIVKVGEGAQVAAALAGNSADIGQSNLASLCNAYEHGVPVVAIAGANMFVSTQHQSELVVLATAPLKDAKDFNGKTVAVAGLKNVQDVGFRKWIDSNGGDSSTVKVLEVPFAAMYEAILTGRIDGAMMTEPSMSAALGTKKVKAFASPLDSIGKEFVLGTWFANTSYVKANPAVIKAYAQAMVMAAEWANKNQGESQKILETNTGISLGVNPARVLFATKLDVKEMQPLIDASAKYGALKNAFPAAKLLTAT